MHKTLFGGCLCGQVRFSLQDDFSGFYFCHCDQCKQLTGSAHASNLFTAADNIQWLSGHELVTNFYHPTRRFSKAFCRECGSALPVVTDAGRALLVPAGSLPADAIPKDLKGQHIYWAEHAHWHDANCSHQKCDTFPQ